MLVKFHPPKGDDPVLKFINLSNIYLGSNIETICQQNTWSTSTYIEKQR
jgi:hypothetical protein